MIVYDNVFTQDEIDQLIRYYKDLPISSIKYLPDGELLRNVKNTNYNLEDQLPYKIIHDKLEKVIGAHHFTGGHYLDSHQPYILHFDNIDYFKSTGVPVYESDLSKEVGVLIPLVANQNFQTMFFDHHLNSPLTDDWMKDLAKNSTQVLPTDVLDLLDHHTPEELESIKHFILDGVAEWKIGRVIVWRRNQLHCSSNFAKHGLTKQAIVLWV